ncbi:outer membrane lipoprotein chaperone LolA [Marinospirillum perlucidum]|uniref:outer membrane lipoprotein chaperone LolA n=1 Tax=Marinospirillum perlucidum TaxID=1982602 RepID=UPI000DF426A6|nr:outer membrane lipoprotein chaperone LolA [Marinospirillum perlucidum]
MFKRLILLVVLVFLVQPLHAATSPEARLETYLENLETVASEFEQQLLDASGQRLQETRGIMRLQKPGRFYWETQFPFPEILVTDGETLWLYDPDLEQVTQQPLDQRQVATPALILSGEASQLSEHFQITYTEGQIEESFTLVPRGEESLFEEMNLYFEEGQIRALRLVDSLGQKTRVDLINPQYNQSLDPAIFDFTPPEGVDVIRDPSLNSDNNG